MHAHQSKEHRAMKEVEGHLSISKASNHEGSTIRIKVQDQTSRVVIAEAEISLEGFADAVTGLAMAECKIKTPEACIHENVGKQVITRNLGLPMPEASKYSKPLLFRSQLKISFQELFAGTIEAGWSIWDYGMSRRQNDPNTHYVILRKYVDANQ